MKKYIAAIFTVVALVACLGLTACGGSSSSSSSTTSSTNTTTTTSTASAADFTVKNDLGVNLIEFYISVESMDEWGTPLAKNFADGAEKSFTFTQCKGTGEGVYDIGTIDKDTINYDFYGIDIKKGDSLTMARQGAAYVLIDKHADGTSQTYEGMSYTN